MDKQTENLLNKKLTKILNKHVHTEINVKVIKPDEEINKCDRTLPALEWSVYRKLKYGDAKFRKEIERTMFKVLMNEA